MLSSGQGSGLTNRTLGQTGGAETHTLTVAEMPVHKHVISETSAGEKITTGLVNNGGGGNFEYPSIQGDINQKWNFTTAVNHTHSVSMANAGGDSAHNNMTPFYVLAFIIRYQ